MIVPPARIRMQLECRQNLGRSLDQDLTGWLG
jgi:hypothetical protein